MTEMQKEVFNKLIGELVISDELKALLKEKGYNRFRDVMAKDIGFLRNKEGLSFEQELELFKVVEANGLEEFWKE